MAQGFPDWEPPRFLKDSLIEVANENEDQYCRSFGHVPLVKRIAAEYSSLFKREIDSMKEVAVGNGASGVLGNIWFSFLNPNDEVVMFIPAFQYHFMQAKMFSPKLVLIPMIPPDENSDEWKYDFASLEKSLNENTKIVLINTPHNPTGKVITKQEMENFVEILRKRPEVIVLSDEVYEHMTFDGRPHLRIATYPDMWERTISTFSLSKTFSCTGWRIGFAIGPSNLIAPINSTQGWLPFCQPRPIQVAFLKALEIAQKPYQGFDSYYKYLNDYFNQKKAIIWDLLTKLPLNIRFLQPDGGFFIIADITNYTEKIPKKYFYKDGESSDDTAVEDWKKLKSPQYGPDSAFCRFLTIEYGITPIPLSPFYDNPTDLDIKEWLGTSLVRFNICKSISSTEILRAKIQKALDLKL